MEQPQPEATPITDGRTYERNRVDDRLEIADLLYRYAYHFDRNEPELVAELFTDHAVIDYGPEVEPIRGRAAIAERIRPGLEGTFVATSHHISNVIIRFVDADTADAVAYVYAWHRYHDRAPLGHLWGQYHVRAARSHDLWRIATLTLKAVAVTDFHRERMHPIGRRRTDADM